MSIQRGSKRGVVVTGEEMELDELVEGENAEKEEIRWAEVGPDKAPDGGEKALDRFSTDRVFNSIIEKHKNKKYITNI